MEKLKLKLRNMEYFVMRIEGATQLEKIRLLTMIEKLKNEIIIIEEIRKEEKLKDGKEVNNEMGTMDEMGNRDSSNNTTIPGNKTKEK